MGASAVEMPFLNGEVGGISKHVPTVEKEGCAISDESHVFRMFLVFIFILIFYTVCGDVIHCFEAAGENDVCDVCVYICMYMCTRTALDMYTLHVRASFG